MSTVTPIIFNLLTGKYERIQSGDTINPSFLPSSAPIVQYVQTSNYTLIAGYSMIVHDEYEIADGIELEIADTAHMEIS